MHLETMLLMDLHVCISVSGTGAVGSPPSVANYKTSDTQPATNEVYLMWDDEAMSMVTISSGYLRLLVHLLHCTDMTYQMFVGLSRRKEGCRCPNIRCMMKPSR
jgi:hypothetical protein